MRNNLAPVAWLGGMLLVAAVISRHGLPHGSAAETAVHSTPVHAWSINGMHVGMSQRAASRMASDSDCTAIYHLGNLQIVGGPELFDGRQCVLTEWSTQKDVDSEFGQFPPMPTQPDMFDKWHGYKLGEGCYLYEHREGYFPGLPPRRVYVLRAEPARPDLPPDVDHLSCTVDF